MSKIVNGLLTLACLLLSVLPSACSNSDGGFGIYIADGGARVLGLDDIKVYHSLDYAFELTASGIERWNSFQTSTTVPKLAQSLFGREFVIKIDGNDLCRGKFYSMVSSSSYDGIVILDSIVKLGTERNSIKLEFGYPGTLPGSGVASDKKRVTTAIEQFFYVRYKLTRDNGFWAQ